MRNKRISQKEKHSNKRRESDRHKVKKNAPVGWMNGWMVVDDDDDADAEADTHLRNYCISFF